MSTNPFFRKKTAEERKAMIAKGLGAAVVTNSSANYQSQVVAQQTYPSQEQYITVTLDKLRPYEHNPRRTPNPNFEMIKESIRRRGLDHAPNVTKRPGESHYIIADGGNTRLQALKELFSETQDPKFWSISCHYKPWQAEDADNVEAELNLLIGHLIENDTRADLTFIEKALGIQQAREYYEKQQEHAISARELAQKLESDGYIIHQSMVSKMERCLDYLYPFIPDVLFSGLGNAPIDKLLTIRNNAENSFLNYQIEGGLIFNHLWGEVLSSHNHDDFKIKDFQFDLIEKMVDALDGETDFDALFLEIDLDEQRFRRLAAKQHQGTLMPAGQQEKSVVEVEAVTDSLPPKHNESSVSTVSETSGGYNEDITDAPDHFVLDSGNATHSINVNEVVSDDVQHTSDIGEQSNVQTTLTELVTENLGLVPGMSIQQHREQTAKENGLSFACVGRQPVAEIWKVYPARKHKTEAFSLALDIAQAFDLHDLVEHVVHTPVDYSFNMKPVDRALSDDQQSIYDCLQLLQTETLNSGEISVSLSHQLLISRIDDVTLVKLFRLIRVVRFIHEQAKQAQEE